MGVFCAFDRPQDGINALSDGNKWGADGIMPCPDGNTSTPDGIIE